MPNAPTGSGLSKPRRPVSDPLQFFGNAVELDSTSRTVRVVHELTRAIKAMPLAPCSVLESLSLELYLKTLAVMEHGDRSHLQDHDYRTLFADLSADTRKTLRDRWDAWVAENMGWASSLKEMTKAFPEFARSDEFDQMIEHNARAFEEWRYCHEFVGKRAIPWTAQPFVGIVRDLIVERKPDWAPLTAHFSSGGSTLLVR
jgi:hypothetical protein